jgi:hypothetical protein
MSKEAKTEGAAPAQVNQPGAAGAVDLTMTWAAVARLIASLAMDGKQQKALRGMLPDLARCAACAQALVALQPTLTEEQKATMSRAMVAALTTYSGEA